jgi:hypothetical protein
MKQESIPFSTLLTKIIGSGVGAPSRVNFENLHFSHSFVMTSHLDAPSENA